MDNAVKLEKDMDWTQKVTPGVKLAHNNKHGFIGVYYDQKRGMYSAEFWHEGKRKRSPRCATAELAARRYDEFVRELRGIGYPTNFPIGNERSFTTVIDLERFCSRGHPRESNMYYRPGTTKGHCRKCQTLAAKRKYERLVFRKRLAVAPDERASSTDEIDG